MNKEQLSNDAIDLLSAMIATPSFSREEEDVSQLIERWMEKQNLAPKRYLNNLYCFAKNHKAGQPTLLLNSHMDTVKPGDGWEFDPFLPMVKEGEKFVGLGSNDAGGCVVSLLAAFRYLNELPELPYNLIVAITAEEEISGRNGIEALLPKLPKIDLAIVGEPTEMHIAVAERGLMVLDVEVEGKTGHAARKEGINAIYKAMEDIGWFTTYEFEQSSEHLGPVGLTVTQVEAGSQHNVVPDLCKYVVDVRLNDQYTHQQVLDLINENINGTAKARSMRLQPSGIDQNHSFVKHIKTLGKETFGSATMSDQALMSCASVKVGPGRSERSHTPDEFIYLSEIREGVNEYIRILEGFTF